MGRAMNIQYFEPLGRGFARMKAALFKPFDLKKWFVVGFTAFLAGLTDGGSGGGGGGAGDGNGGGVDTDFANVLDAPYSALQWLKDNPEYMIAVLMGVVFVIGLIVVLVWLSSRGKFMFLYNVVNDRAEVSTPWREYTHLGNSLFLWRIAFIFISLAIVIGFFVNVWQNTYNLYFDRAEQVPIGYLIQMGFLFLLIVLVIGYIDMLLSEFVVPVMYKHDLTAVKAWNKFLSVHWSNFWSFVLFGLFRLLLFILVGILYLFFGLFTCCLGFLFLFIPYINSVVTLPISYTFRSFSLEFLAQFGDDFVLFPSEMDSDYPSAVG